MNRKKLSAFVEPMHAQIYTDASLHNDHPHGNEPLAGGGALIYHNGMVRLKRVYFAEDINAAETRMIYLASRLVYEMSRPDEIIVYTDAQSVIDCYYGSRSSETKDHFRRELDRLWGFFPSKGVNLELEWVEGHQHEPNFHGRLNKKVDRMAREAVDPYLEGGLLPASAYEREMGTVHT